LLNWLLDGPRLLAIAIIFATLVGAWMFRQYEPYPNYDFLHRNRITGAVCYAYEECWLSDSLPNLGIRIEAPDTQRERSEH
jgi:hypothetical protein